MALAPRRCAGWCRWTPLPAPSCTPHAHNPLTSLARCAAAVAAAAAGAIDQLRSQPAVG
jgi:hypothetical protein